MHQSFVTPATLGPGKCRGLRGLSALILFGSCVVLIVSSAVVVRAFDFLPNIDRELAD